MARQTPRTQGKRLVWRMTDNAPMGEWVDPSLPPEPKARKDMPEVSSGNWVVSSFDLLQGVEVNDDPNTVPDDLFDELFPPPDDRKAGGK